MNTNQLRKKFIDYFVAHQHTLVPSSTLIPANDPTLLFTNAGMVQFKDVFLGHEQRHYQQAVSSQRCVRAGGKHNDLENVGYTARHHTFFEMLGNFSFGAYFKREAIQYAWNFLTQELKIAPEKLWVTVHVSDAEAETIWLKEVGIDPQRFSRCEEDNFWSMGDVGPCGPCTEIFYDHGPEIPGGPPGSPAADGDRYVEIWNLVFMQFNRAADGRLTALPKPSVDTGMGLERIAAVMQGVHSNYAIDLFKVLITAVAKIAATQDLTQPSLRVIADHIRSVSFLILDGVRPSNEGRGYVLRRIIRRALRHGYKLGLQQAFLYRLVAPLQECMGTAYPELRQQQALIEKVLQQEEEQFSRTLSQGLKVFQQAIDDSAKTELSGEIIFKLYDTYGFPVDLCADMAREHGVTLNMADFETCMQRQRQQSQARSHFTMLERLPTEGLAATEFVGYVQLQHSGAVRAILQNHVFTQHMSTGSEGIVVLDKTPFYPEGGGQVGDVGTLLAPGVEFVVKNTTKQDNIVLHHGTLVRGTLKVGMNLEAGVNQATRIATQLNHSATHLLHAALRVVLGTHVVQKGSLVCPEYLRFDFAHFAALTPNELATIEQIVNREIRANTKIVAQWLEKSVALQQGALALFEEKYADNVRVLTVGGNFSVELCGGTHANYTGDIGLFKITQETGIAAGVRRIEAITGEVALQFMLTLEQQLRDLAGLLKTSREQTVGKLQQVFERTKLLEKDLGRANSKIVHYALQSLINNAVSVNGVQIVAAVVEELSRKSLKEAVEQLLQKIEPAVVCLATVEAGQISLLCGVSQTLMASTPAHLLLQFVAQQVGGKGGGKPDFAQGGGIEVSRLSQALASVADWVTQRQGL